VRCLAVEARSPDGIHDLAVHNIVGSGFSAGFHLRNFPSGPLTLQASGFSQPCRQNDAPAIWLSEPKVITVTPGAHHKQPVTFEPGDVEVEITYGGIQSQCPDGQFQCRLADDSLDACSDHTSDSTACGPSCTACTATQSCTNSVCVTAPPVTNPPAEGLVF